MAHPDLDHSLLLAIRFAANSMIPGHGGTRARATQVEQRRDALRNLFDTIDHVASELYDTHELPDNVEMRSDGIFIRKGPR